MNEGNLKRYYSKVIKLQWTGIRHCHSDNYKMLHFRNEAIRRNSVALIVRQDTAQAARADT